MNMSLLRMMAVPTIVGLNTAPSYQIGGTLPYILEPAPPPVRVPSAAEMERMEAARAKRKRKAERQRKQIEASRGAEGQG